MPRTAATSRTAASGRSAASGRTLVSARGFGPPTITNNVTYDTTTTGQPHKLNIYEQPELPAHATIVHVHGGAWTSVVSAAGGFTKDSPAIIDIDRAFAGRGFLVLSIDYRLVPVASGNTDTSYRDDMIAGVKRAVSWARANADDYNGPTDKIVLFGGSVGGHLALMATIQGIAADSRPDLCLVWSPLPRLDQEGNATAIKNYLGISTDPSGAGAATAQLYSPYDQWGAGIATPVRICEFETDLAGINPVSANDMETRIEAQGGTATLVTVSGSGHADFRGTTEFDNGVAWILSNP